MGKVRVTMQTLVTNALRLVRSAQSTPIRCIKTAPAPVSAFACAPGSLLDVPVKNLAGEQVDTISLDPDVFGLPMRRDIVHRVATWQRACRLHQKALLAKGLCQRTCRQCTGSSEEGWWCGSRPQTKGLFLYPAKEGPQARTRYDLVSQAARRSAYCRARLGVGNPQNKRVGKIAGSTRPHEFSVC